MSTHSLNSSSALLKRIASIATSAIVLAIAFLFLQTRPTLHGTIRPVYAAESLFHPASFLLPRSREFWHTQGNQILDTRNQPVRISGTNWSGLETKEAVPGGLESQDYRAILDTIKGNGFNTVRLPFSNEMVESPAVPEHIRFDNAAGPINADLRDLNSLEIMDKVIAYAGEIGLKVILDNHRSEAGSSAEGNGLWYTEQYPESAWIADWTSLAHRYAANPAVIGMDLRNEPHNAAKDGACWDCGGSRDWHRAAERAGNAVLAVNPRLLIFVEGVDSYGGDTYWWGGNLEGVRRSPVHLSTPNRLVYSAHEYGPTEYGQSWFDASTTPASLASVWRRHWAYISEAGIAPVWIGEFGTPNSDIDVRDSTPGSEGQWFSSLIQFLAGHPSIHWTYWGVNGEDRYGLFDRTYSGRPMNQLKAQALAAARTAITEPTVAPLTSIAAENAPSYPVVPTTFAPPAVVAATAVVYAQPAQVAEPAGSPARHLRGTQIAAERPAATPENDSVESAIAISIHTAVSTANLNLQEGSEPASR